MSFEFSRHRVNGGHQFRLPMEKMPELYTDAESAARCGDFPWISRFCPGDRELVVIALSMMGNAVGAEYFFKALLVKTQRSNLFRALNQ